VIRFLKHPLTPLLLLLTVNLTVGFLTFRDYGMSWDEPLFYDYADSIRLAYTPAAYAPGFDFYQVFGKSPEDHKIYGPAYLLLARPVQRAVMIIFNADMASAWHLVNFWTFQLGLVAFYGLIRRWLEPWPSAAATAFLAWQPIFWGHAFINPKDAPFMVFFLSALALGLDFVDRLTDSQRVSGVGAKSQVEPPHLPWRAVPGRTQSAQSYKGLLSDLGGLRGKNKTMWVSLILAGLALGLTSAIRVIGPLAGMIVGVYFLLKIALPSPLQQAQCSASAFSPREKRFLNWRAFPFFIAYGLIALVVMFGFWPYLWADPINRLLEVLKHMSNNPTELAVLFEGQVFRANEMPRRYLPQVFAMTLTEPTWVVFFAGLAVAIRSFFAKKSNSEPKVPGTGLNKTLSSKNKPRLAGLNLKTWCKALSLQKQVDWRAPLVVLGLFVFMLAYLLYNKPSVYDGFRHFLFITPPVFVFVGFSLQWLWEKLKPTLWSTTIVLLLLPGLMGIVRLHPYEYAYYNQLVGGVGGAYRTYETEYWLTCYKEAFEWLRANEPGSTLHIQREFSLAEYYAEGLIVKDLSRETESDLRPGDLLLFHTRANLDLRSNYRKLPVEQVVGRDGAEFCLIKRKNCP